MGVALAGTDGAGVGRALGAEEGFGDAGGVRDGVGVGAGELAGTTNPPGVPTDTGADALSSLWSSIRLPMKPVAPAARIKISRSPSERRRADPETN